MLEQLPKGNACELTRGTNCGGLCFDVDLRNSWPSGRCEGSRLYLVNHKNEAAVVARLSPYRSKVGDKTMRRNVDLRGERYAELWIARRLDDAGQNALASTKNRCRVPRSAVKLQGVEEGLVALCYLVEYSTN